MRFQTFLAFVLILTLPACSLVHRNHQGARAFFSPVSEEKMRQDIQAYMQQAAAEGDEPVVSAAEIIPLPINEQLVYKVKWFGLTVGTVKISITDMETIQDRPAYVVEALAETAGFFKLWPVHDRFVSYMDAENLSVLRHEVYRREGKYKKDAIVDFDHQTGQAHYRHLLDGTNKTYDIPPNVHDALTMVYYFRAKDLKAGDQFNLLAYADEKNYEISGQIESDRPVKVSGLGMLPVFFVKPQARWNNEEVDSGSAQLYVSADAQKIPLRAIVSGPIFSSITLTLETIIREG